MSFQINETLHLPTTMANGSLTSDESHSMSQKDKTSYDREKHPLSYEPVQAAAIEPGPPALTFPEGGARAWLTVLGG